VNFSGGQCSGSVIAPRLVLTARHCVAHTAGSELQVVCGTTKFEPPDSPGAIFVVPKPTITDDPKDYVAVSDILTPAGLGAELCGTDVVLLELKDPLPGITPIAPRVDEPVMAGEGYSSVGYGIDESLADKPSGERKRLDGLKITCSGSACKDTEVLDNEWVGSGGPCQGDSGGPALDADGRIVGVVSRGKPGCTEPVFSDLASRGEWMKSEAIAVAYAANQAPPDWAPCNDTEPCVRPAIDGSAGAAGDTSGPSDSGPAETCALSRAPTTGFSNWLVGLAAVAGLRRRARRIMVRLRHGIRRNRSSGRSRTFSRLR
jgi:hypothetical protein